MDFQDFLKLLPEIQNAELLGETAHAKMSPPERARLMQDFDWNNPNARTAAVTLLLYPRNDKTYFVLILRNAYKGVHSSQVAFPGGKREKEDKSYQETALRETCEEVGISKDKVIVVRELSKIYIPPSNFIVFPFLAYCSEPPIFKPDPREVAGIIEVELDLFLDDATVTGMVMETSYANQTDVPGFQIGEHIVWGATAMILSEFKEVIKAVAKT